RRGGKNTKAEPGGRDPLEVAGVREEREDALDRLWEPLPRLEQARSARRAPRHDRPWLVFGGAAGPQRALFIFPARPSVKSSASARRRTSSVSSSPRRSANWRPSGRMSLTRTLSLLTSNSGRAGPNDSVGAVATAIDITRPPGSW